MVTTLTATPQIDTATVLLQVSGPAAEYPVDVINLSAGQILAEAETAWSGFDEVTLYGDLVAFYTLAATSSVGRTVAGLIVGRRYRLTLRAQRNATESSQFGVLTIGGSGIPIGAGVWAHTYEFTATATTHTIYFATYQNNNPYIAGVSVTLLPVGTYDLGRFTLTRTDANGTRSVRLLDGQEIIDGTLIVEDAEAAMVGPVSYQLTSASGAVSQVVTTLDGAGGYRLAPAVYPQWAVTADLVTGYDATRPSSSVVHEIIGREDPVVRLGPLKLRRGTLTFWCASYATLRAALDVYRRGEVVLLRQPDFPGFDMYHVVTEARESGYDEGRQRWRLDVTFIEQNYPLGPLLGAARWTWDDLVALCSTWDDVARMFPTWNDAQIGPVS